MPLVKASPYANGYVFSIQFEHFIGLLDIVVCFTVFILGMFHRCNPLKQVYSKHMGRINKYVNLAPEVEDIHRL